jgi:hypothetical protein
MATTYPIDTQWDYRDLVHLTATGETSKGVRLTDSRIPTFTPLAKFLRNSVEDPKKWEKIECKISLFEINKNKPDLGEKPVHMGFDGINSKLHAQLEEKLKVGPQKGSSRLFLVQNITPDVLVLFGNRLNVPPGFFLSHLENSNWYSLQNIPQNLPALRSIQSHLPYVRFQFVAPREFEEKDDCKLCHLLQKNMYAKAPMSTQH